MGILIFPSWVVLLLRYFQPLITRKSFIAWFGPRAEPIRLSYILVHIYTHHTQAYYLQYVRAGFKRPKVSQPRLHEQLGYSTYQGLHTEAHDEQQWKITQRSFQWKSVLPGGGAMHRNCDPPATDLLKKGKKWPGASVGKPDVFASIYVQLHPAQNTLQDAGLIGHYAGLSAARRFLE